VNLYCLVLLGSGTEMGEMKSAREGSGEVIEEGSHPGNAYDVIA